jgi:hypothetical protein
MGQWIGMFFMIFVNECRGFLQVYRTGFWNWLCLLEAWKPLHPTIKIPVDSNQKWVFDSF